MLYIYTEKSFEEVFSIVQNGYSQDGNVVMEYEGKILVLGILDDIYDHAESLFETITSDIAAKYIEDKVYKVKDLVEKPEPGKAPSNIAILGRYIITPEIFDILETLPLGKNGEVQLTDALRMLSKKEAMYAYDFDGVRYDVGDKLGFLKATVDFALKRPNLQNDFIQYLREVCDKFDKKTTENEQ